MTRTDASVATQEAGPTALPLVTVMIPTYNQAGYLGAAIGSALAQDYPRLEVVVADDGSTDTTPEVAGRFADDRLRVHRNARNLGRVGNYRHLLYDLARGDWVINLDGDDCFLDPGYIRRAIGLALSDAAIVMVFARALKGSDAASATLINAVPDVPAVIEGSRFIVTFPPFGTMAPLHPTCLYQRQPAIALGFHREDILSSDFESLYRLMLGRKVGFIDTPAALWRQHGANASASTSYAALRANVAVFEGPYRHALATGALAPAEAERWLDRRLARYLVSAMARAVRGGLPPGHALRLAADLIRRRPTCMLAVPAALGIVLRERSGT